ncbi:MAG: hypothetical protein LBI82_11525 [Dysgonamonadaceae bacterium]|jgi:hypothetical protein|nr:hypothetical protein [Dysgonamonadaceae bacterium]
MNEINPIELGRQYEFLIQLGGIFHFICGLFHLIFPRMFKWEEHLSGLSKEDLKVIKGNLYTSNICVMLFWFMLAYIPFFFPHEILTTQIGKALLTAIVVIWIIRIFILHPVFSNIKEQLSILRVAFFFIGFLLFFIPWIMCVIL